MAADLEGGNLPRALAVIAAAARDTHPSDGTDFWDQWDDMIAGLQPLDAQVEAQPLLGHTPRPPPPPLRLAAPELVFTAVAPPVSLPGEAQPILTSEQQEQVAKVHTRIQLWMGLVIAPIDKLVFAPLPSTGLWIPRSTGRTIRMVYFLWVVAAVVTVFASTPQPCVETQPFTTAFLPYSYLAVLAALKSLRWLALTTPLTCADIPLFLTFAVKPVLTVGMLFAAMSYSNSDPILTLLQYMVLVFNSGSTIGDGQIFLQREQAFAAKSPCLYLMCIIGRWVDRLLFALPLLILVVGFVLYPIFPLIWIPTRAIQFRLAARSKAILLNNSQPLTWRHWFWVILYMLLANGITTIVLSVYCSWLASVTANLYLGHSWTGAIVADWQARSISCALNSNTGPANVLLWLFWW